MSSPGGRMPLAKGLDHGLVAGPRAVAQGLLLLARDAAVRRWVLWPFALSLLLSALFSAAFLYFSRDLLSVVWRPPSGSEDRLWGLGLIIFDVVGLLATFFVSLWVGKLASGPFYDRLVAEVFRRRGLAFVDQGLRAALLNEWQLFTRFGLPAIACGLLSFVPVLGFAFSAASLAFGALGMGASVWSVVLMGHGRSAEERRGLLRERRALQLGLGASATLLAFIPVVGLLGFPAAVAGFADVFAEGVTGDTHAPRNELSAATQVRTAGNTKVPPS